MQRYTIGRLAAAAGVPVSTIRFYEREGLFKPDARTAGNYRSYAPDALERLRFIRAAQKTGFSLRDVAEMLDLAHAAQSPCREVRTLMERRLAEVRQRLRDLRRVEKAMSQALKTCCRGGPDWCEQIERLKRAPSTAHPTRAKCCAGA